MLQCSRHQPAVPLCCARQQQAAVVLIVVANRPTKFTAVPDAQACSRGQQPDRVYYVSVSAPTRCYCCCLNSNWSYCIDSVCASATVETRANQSSTGCVLLGCVRQQQRDVCPAVFAEQACCCNRTGASICAVSSLCACCCVQAVCNGERSRGASVHARLLDANTNH